MSKEFYEFEKELIAIVTADPMGSKHYDPVHDHSIYGDVRWRMRMDIRRAMSEYLQACNRPHYSGSPDYRKWFRKSLIMALHPTFLHTQQLARAILLIDKLGSYYAVEKGDMDGLLDRLPGGKEFEAVGEDIKSEEAMRMRLLLLPRAITMTVSLERVRKLVGNGSIYNREQLALKLGAFGLAEHMKSTTYYFKNYETYVDGVDRLTTMEAEACSELERLVA